MPAHDDPKAVPTAPDAPAAPGACPRAPGAPTAAEAPFAVPDAPTVCQVLASCAAALAVSTPPRPEDGEF